MKVSSLYAPHGPFVGADVFVVGTGSSMSLFPINTLEGKTCFLLNDSCRYFPSLSPLAFSNNLSFVKFCDLPYQVVKGRLRFDPNPEQTDNHCPWSHEKYHVYSYRDPVMVTATGARIQTTDTLSHLDERSLWREPDFYFNVAGGSVSIFAVQFALLCGVRSITLVGCDCNQIGQEHYVAGKKPRQHRHAYNQYAAGLQRMWIECQKRGVPMMSLTPFFGLGYHERQYREMREWQQKRNSLSQPNGEKPNQPASDAVAAETSHT